MYKFHFLQLNKEGPNQEGSCGDRNGRLWMKAILPVNWESTKKKPKKGLKKQVGKE